MKNKPPVAIRYLEGKNNNYLFCKEIIGVYLQSQKHTGEVILNNSLTGKDTIVNPGDWLVKEQTKQWQVITNAEFQSRYEEPIRFI